MGFNFDGSVLRAPRSAPSNASTTGNTINGVSRDHKPLPGSYDFTVPFAETAGDQYRASTILNPDGEQEEYLLWAANTSSLTILESTAWTVEADDPEGSTTIPSGDIPVYNDPLLLPATIVNDGTSRIVVQDTGGRALAEIRLLVIQRGDTGLQYQVGPAAATNFASQDADGGIAVLPASLLGDASTPNPATLDGGVSRLRGDSIVRVDYVLAAARFWWTRNDAIATRFAWNGKTQRWEPNKGNAPRDLDILIPDGQYLLSPRPSRFNVGDTLPYVSGTPSDTFAIVRVGIRPDASAVTPEVLVVPDEDVEEGYTFTGPTPDAVLGVTNGILVFNNTTGGFIDNYAGQTVWYMAEEFTEDSNGELGDLRTAADDDTPLFLVPIPRATERPFVRLGFRRYLTPIAYDNDNDLNGAPAPGEGTFAWSATTGKIRLAQADINKADPDIVSFNVLYHGAKVYYDGISMTMRSLSTRAPVQLVDSSGNPATLSTNVELFIPDAEPLPG